LCDNHLVSGVKGRTHRLRVFGNMVLRRIFGPKRDEVTGGWRKLHNEEDIITEKAENQLLSHNILHY
jgi:hypothetical protein